MQLVFTGIKEQHEAIYERVKQWQSYPLLCLFCPPIHRIGKCEDCYFFLLAVVDGQPGTRHHRSTHPSHEDKAVGDGPDDHGHFVPNSGAGEGSSEYFGKTALKGEQTRKVRWERGRELVGSRLVLPTLQRGFRTTSRGKETVEIRHVW